MAGQNSRIPYPPCQAGICLSPSCCAAGGKFRWPELMGVDAQRAKAVIESQNSISTVVLMGPGRVGMPDFCCNRIYLFFDGNNRVNRIPTVG